MSAKDTARIGVLEQTVKALKLQVEVQQGLIEAFRNDLVAPESELDLSKFPYPRVLRAMGHKPPSERGLAPTAEDADVPFGSASLNTREIS